MSDMGSQERSPSKTTPRHVLLVTLLVLSACGASVDDNGDSQQITAQATPTTVVAATTTAAPPPTDPPPSSDEDEARVIELTLGDPPLYDSGAGVTLRIEGVRVGDLTSLPTEMREDLEIGIDDPNSQSFLIMTLTVENASDAPVSFFPDQSTALVGSHQVDANFWFSEPFTGTGGTILDGASVTRDVYFELADRADDVAALRQARFTCNGPFDPESFASLGADVDLVVEWDS